MIRRNGKLLFSLGLALVLALVVVLLAVPRVLPERPITTTGAVDRQAPAAEPVRLAQARQEPLAELKQLPDPASAQAGALADLRKVPEAETVFYRYLWIPANPALSKDIKVTSFVLNWISNAALIRRPPVLGGQAALVQVDLRLYAPRQTDLNRWIQTWELLATDPTFGLLITADTLRLISAAGGEMPSGVKEVTTKGVRLSRKGKEEDEDVWVNVVRLPAPCLDPAVTAELETLTGSAAPVVEFRYFVMRALASIQEDGLYRDVWGGLYYEFVGLADPAKLIRLADAKEEKKDEKKATDLDKLFERLGVIDKADGDVKARDKLDRLLSEQRVAILKSAVTGKPRAVWIIPTLATVRQRSVVMLTADRKDKNVDLQKLVFANLLEFAPDALEVFWVDTAGSTKYALYDGAFALQREVPPDVAADHTIPEPYTRRLQILSCAICHGRPGLDGWQPLPNQVLTGKNGAGPLADTSNRKGSITETLELLASKYAGNADGLLADLRRDTIGVTLRATGPYADDKEQLRTMTLTAGRLEEIRREYWYTSVDAKLALTEIGIDPGKTDPLTTLRELLPPNAADRNDLLAVIPEDVRTAQVLAGNAIGREDWDLVKAFVATRAYKTLAARAAKEKGKG